MPATLQYRAIMVYGVLRREPSANCALGVDGSSRRAKYDQERVDEYHIFIFPWRPAIGPDTRRSAATLQVCGHKHPLGKIQQATQLDTRPLKTSW